MSDVAQRLLAITPATPDLIVAAMLAEKCIEIAYPPFLFAINHDIRPPKNLGCPLDYHWTRKDLVGIEIKSAPEMRRWLTEAFIRGYTVHRMSRERTKIGFPHSIAIARQRAEMAQRPKPENDDDIPF